MGTATLEFKLKERTATIWVRNMNSLSDAVSLAQAVAPYSNAGITRVGFTVSQDVNTPEGVEDIQDMRTYGIAFFRDQEENIVKFVFPSPKLSLFELENSRYTLKKINGDALATIFGQKTGKTLTFRHGGLSSR